MSVDLNDTCLKTFLRILELSKEKVEFQLLKNYALKSLFLLSKNKEFLKLLILKDENQAILKKVIEISKEEFSEKVPSLELVENDYANCIKN